jgi:hypothetical protein
LQKGDRSLVGKDSIDFLGGQVKGQRTHLESQLLPGDYEAIIGQGKIASRIDEHRLSGDKGVVLFRNILTDALSSDHSSANAMNMHRHQTKFFRSFTQNTILNIKAHPDVKEDKKLIESIGKKIIQIMEEAPSDEPERTNYVIKKLAEIEKI